MSEELKHKLYTSTECISEEVMYQYIDKKLSSSEEHKVERHLLDCELCSDALEGLTISHNRKIPNSINIQVDKQLLAAEKSTKIVSINYKTVWAVAAGLLLLVGGVFFFNQFMSKNMEMADATKLESSPTEEAELQFNAEKPLTDSTAAAPSSNTGENVQQERENNKNEIAFIAPKTTSDEAEGIVTNSPIVENYSTVVTGANEYAQINDEESATSKDQSSKLAEDSRKAETLNATSKAENTQATYEWKSAPAPSTISKKEISQEKNVVIKEETGGKKRSKKNEGAASAQQPSGYYNQDITLAESQEIASEQKNKAEKNRDDQVNYKYLTATDSTISTDEMPKFPGGEIELMKFITKNFKYSSTKGDFSSTKIYLEFIIDKTGSVTNAKVIKGINPELDKEALRVINSMPKWTPGKQAGKPIDVIMQYPIQLEFK
jgi:TonB family protein